MNETATTKSFAQIWTEAAIAAKDAGEAAKPTPMNVVGHGQHYHVPEGPCGFAWVQLYCKGNARSFVLWLKKQRIATKAYPSGFMIWISDFGQSMERKQAAAHAMAKVFRDHGIECFPQSRMD